MKYRATACLFIKVSTSSTCRWSIEQPPAVFIKVSTSSTCLPGLCWDKNLEDGTVQKWEKVAWPGSCFKKYVEFSGLQKLVSGPNESEEEIISGNRGLFQFITSRSPSALLSIVTKRCTNQYTMLPWISEKVSIRRFGSRSPQNETASRMLPKATALWRLRRLWRLPLFRSEP